MDILWINTEPSAIDRKDLNHMLAVRPTAPNGTAGKFYNQTFEEYCQISTLVARFCEEKRLPFQIGASHMSPIERLRRIEMAASLRPVAYR